MGNTINKLKMPYLEIDMNSSFWRRLAVDDGNMIWQSDANPPSPFAVWRCAVNHMTVGERGEWDRLLRCECASTGVENGGAGRCLTATLYEEVRRG